MEFLAPALAVGFICAFLYGVAKLWLTHRENKARIAAEAASGVAAASAHEEIAALRERVQILERLVTDDDRRVAHEIERLKRDEARL